MAVSVDIELWGAAKVAEELDLSLDTVYRYVRWGRLPEPLRVAGGNRRSMVWLASDFRRWMEEHWL